MEKEEIHGNVTNTYIIKCHIVTLAFFSAVPGSLLEQYMCVKSFWHSKVMHAKLTLQNYLCKDEVQAQVLWGKNYNKPYTVMQLKKICWTFTNCK